MVTARMTNQKAKKVITADTSMEAAEVSDRESGAVMSLLGRRTVEASAQEAAAAGEGEKVIRLPEAGLVLTKLPPIRDTVSLPPAPQVGCGWSARGHVTRTHDLIGQASPPVLCPARLYPRGSYPPSHRRSKEPKFVPYEPYRGAVAFMENKPGKPSKFISRQVS